MNRRPPLDHPDLFHRLDHWDRLIAPALGEAEVKRRAISRALEHERQAGRTKRKPRSKILQGRITLAEIGRLIQHRHNGSCDTDEGETYLKAALPCLIEEAGGFDADWCEERVRAWVRVATPRLTEPEIRFSMDEARERNARGRLYWGSQDLGDLLHLSKAEREALGITKARPRGMTAKTFAAYQRAQKTAAEKARRIAAGAKAREQSDAQIKPWEALGISRRKFYRDRKAMPEIGRGTNSCLAGTKYRIAATDQCHQDNRPIQGPARTAHPRRSVGADGPSPGAKTRSVPAGHAVSLPLPIDGVSEHLDLIDGLGEWRQVGAPLVAYEGGVLPPELARAVREAMRVRMMTQEALANQVGVSRPQIGNVLRGRFGLSKSAASNLMQWLAA